MKKILASIAASIILSSSVFYFEFVKPTMAGVSCSLPNTLTNGTTADATQVMANYTALVNCLLNAAAAGANNDITSLSALTSPITPTQGGSNVFIGSTPTVSGSELIIASTTPTGFSNTKGYSVIFAATATNAGATTMSVNGQAQVNLYKQSTAGPIPFTGSELQIGQIYQATYDGTEFQTIALGGFASLTATGQVISGGANVTSFNGGSQSGGGTYTVNCGNSPLQYITDAGSFTIAAPSSDGSCDLLVTNNASAATPSTSGFASLTNSGDAYSPTNGNKYIYHIERVNGTAFFFIKALQ